MPRVQTENRPGGVLIARIGTHPLGLIERDEAAEIVALIERAHRDPTVRAVVFTGTHPERFVAHADLGWLQADGSVIPPLGRHLSGLVIRTAQALARVTPLRALARRTPMTGAVQLAQIHDALTRMTTSSTIFAAALNGSVLGLGAELSWACDLRIMAEGDHVIGHPEILLGFPPGAGGTQRLGRLIGAHQAALAILEGRPFTVEEALAAGVIDETAPPEKLLNLAVERAANLSARPSSAIAGVKRAVHVGGSRPLARGLALEGSEFLAALPRKVAQRIMRRYIAATDRDGELPLYRPGGYAAALEHGDADVDPAPVAPR